MNVPSRNAKGLKIERLLKISQTHQPLRVLDIGTGSGGIAHYFGVHDNLDCEVVSVDVVDQRQIYEGYTFVESKGVKLPFEDRNFDVVISNHVIEHVGLRYEQAYHLSEISRVLATDGLGYLAVPNRWMLVEPHYRLAFLSWLPRGWRSSYLNFMKGISFYDCEPLTVPELEVLLQESGLRYQHLHIESLREFVNIEKVSIAARLVAVQPDCLLRLVRRLTPTLIYKIER
jgi:ubiquinone/menaquinone biosynthesis C-methylase UbiE